MTEKSMDDVLNDKVPNEIPQQETETPAEQPVSRRKEHQRKEWEAQGRDPDTGQFAKKDAPKEEPKVETKPEPEVKAEVKPEVKKEEKQEFTDREKAFLKGLEEERRKRQEYERRLADLEKVAKPEEPKKSFYEDPDGELARVKQEMAAVVQNATVHTRLSTSEMIARSRYQDFDSMAEHFKEIAGQNPLLVAQMVNSPDPAEFVYRTSKNHKAIIEAGNIDSLLEKARAEAKTQALEEFKKRHEQALAEAAKARDALPASLSDAKGTTKKAVEWNGPTSLDSLFSK